MLALPQPPPHARLWIAYSGGLDSTVLLHLARAAGLAPRAVHVDHRLQAASSSWAEHCRTICAQWSVPFEFREVRIADGDPAGPEAAARAARYAALRSVLAPGDLLATAHHQSDQAETVLLRALRGTGVAGLAGMPALAPFAPGQLWRPLLAVPRKDLLAYAQSQGLRWIDDPHNADPRYARSFLRAGVLPNLRERWPALDENLARLAAHAADAQDLLAALADGDLAELARGSVLPVSGLRRLGVARRHNALRRWLQRGKLDTPAADALARVDAEVLNARIDAEPCVAFGDTELRRYRDGLHAMRRLPPAPGDVELQWSSTDLLVLPPGCGELRLEAPPPRALRVRFVRGGERLKPACGGPTRTLKNLFQEAGVPGWVRVRTPLIELDGRLAAVGDYWWTQDWQDFAREGCGELRWNCALERPAPQGKIKAKLSF